MRASICIATHNKPHYLNLTLTSIFRQTVPFDFEVCVVDDGSPGVETASVCKQYPVRYHRIDREPGFLNQSRARNVAYRMARGDVVISQSDDTVHVTHNCIVRLVNDLRPGHFIVANVLNTDEAGNLVKSYGITEYTGRSRKVPFFFLGSLWREDIYRIGGNDEEFMVAPAWEDNWFGDCLTRGLGLVGDYSTNIVGHHLDHPRTTNPVNTKPAEEVYKRKKAAALAGKGPWCASGGPWEYTP